MQTRESACEGKRKFNESQAKWHARLEWKRKPQRPYKCPFCKKWHLATMKRVKIDRLFEQVHQQLHPEQRSNV